MDQLSSKKSGSHTIRAGGIHTDIDSSLATMQPKPKKEYSRGVYLVARVMILIVAAVCILGSMMLAMDGSWEIATICFILGIFFFIPFILFGRKIRDMNKIKGRGPGRR